MVGYRYLQQGTKQGKVAQKVLQSDTPGFAHKTREAGSPWSERPSLRCIFVMLKMENLTEEILQ